MEQKPLYVDLDGTLIKSDLLHESLLGLMKRNPLALFLIPRWLWNGRAHMKRAIAERVTIDVASLPYSESFLAISNRNRLPAGSSCWPPRPTRNTRASATDLIATVRIECRPRDYFG